jgi:hypothetical protein
MKIIPAIVAVTLLLFGIYPQGDKDKPKSQESDISGYYRCAGKDVSGEVYQGVVTIKKVKTVYVVSWSVELSTSIGVGQRNGNQLVVGWKTSGGSFGCTVYQIKDKSLTGTYVGSGSGGEILSETLELLMPLPKALKKDV